MTFESYCKEHALFFPDEKSALHMPRLTVYPFALHKTIFLSRHYSVKLFARMCEISKASVGGRTPRDTVIDAWIMIFELLYLDMCLITGKSGLVPPCYYRSMSMFSFIRAIRPKWWTPSNWLPHDQLWNQWCQWSSGLWLPYILISLFVLYMKSCVTSREKLQNNLFCVSRLAI